MNEETAWTPGRSDLPWTISLINPDGDRHLGFNDKEGRFYRLWQHRRPEPLRTEEAIMLRPSDIDQIIKVASMWALKHADESRSGEILFEAAVGAKAVVVHFAGLSQRSH